jgi:hypothetical protein
MRPVTLSLLCLLGATALKADLPDLGYRKQVTLDLSVADKGYRLTGGIRVSQSLNSARAAKASEVRIPEYFFAGIADLEASLDGRPLKREQFTFHYPRLEDIFLSSTRIHEVDFPRALAAGDSFEYAYRENYLDLAYSPQLSIPALDQVKEYQLTVRHPSDVKVDFALAFPQGEVPYEIQHPSPTTTILAFKDLARPKELSYLPDGDSLAIIQPLFSKGGAPLTPSTPEAFTRWYLGLTPSTDLTQETWPADLKRDLEGASGPAAKLRKLYDFVRGRIRYIADESHLGAIVPRPPALVLSRGYGDCKDKALLLCALARAEGIPAEMALLSTAGEPPFPSVHISQFNHAICCAQLDGKDLFLDPTQQDLALGDLPDGDIGREALVLDPQRPRMAAIPNPQAAPELEIRIAGDPADPRHGKAEVVLRHGLLARMRRARRELKGLDLENFMSNTLNSFLARASLDRFTWKEEGPEEGRLDCAADLSEFIVSSPTRMYVPETPFLTVDAGMLARKGDALPLGAGPLWWLRMQVTLPKGQLSASPQKLDLPAGGPSGFRASCQEGPSGITIDYEYRQTRHTLAGEPRAAFLAFCENYLASKRNLFILSRRGS